MSAWSVVWRAVPVVLVRFPVPIFIAIAATAFHFLWPSAVARLPAHAPQIADAGRRIFEIALPAFLFATAGILFAEPRGWGAGRRHAFALVLAAAAGAVVGGRSVTHSAPALVAIAGLCSVMLAPGGMRRRDSGFWWHAARTAGGIVTALAGAVLLCVGVLLIESAIRVLFQLRTPGFFPPFAATYVAPVAFGIVAPLLWLGRIPAAGEAERILPAEVRAPLVLARFVAVPLLIAFGAVLIAYAARIAWLGVVPAGQIGRYVPAFGVIGTFVFMMLLPERGKGRRLVDLYCAIWFPLLAVPLGLLAVALWLRIEPFGFTVQRGLLLLAAAWLAIITVLFAPRLGRGDVRLVPGVLLALCLVFAAGPFGIVAIANRDQARQLTELLASAGVLEDGRVAQTSIGTLDMRQRVRAQSIIRYLGRSDGLATLAPLFAGRDDDPFRKAERPDAAAMELRITGFPRDAARGVAAAVPRLDVSVKGGPAVIAEAGGVRVLGPFNVGFGRRQPVASVDGITTTVEDNVLRVDAADGRSARLDLAAALQSRDREAVGRPPRIEGPLRLAVPFGTGKVEAVLQGVMLSVTQTETIVRGGSYFLVLAPAR